jgi:hypothetical protein
MGGARHRSREPQNSDLAGEDWHNGCATHGDSDYRGGSAHSGGPAGPGDRTGHRIDLLGLAAGLGFEGTIKAITEGFGEIMAEVGLLIGFGVLLGSLLFSVGALQRLVELLLRVAGPKKLPYALSAALSAVFPSIYVDVQLVLAAPIARSAAPRVRTDSR